jgi:hypothetical protein
MKKEILYNQLTGNYEIRGHSNKDLVTLKLEQNKQLNTPIGEAHKLEFPSSACDAVMELIQFIEYCKNTGTFHRSTVNTATIWLERFGFPPSLTPNIRFGEIETAKAIKYLEKNDVKMKGFNILNALLIASLFEDMTKKEDQDATNKILFLEDYRSKTAN